MPKSDLNAVRRFIVGIGSPEAIVMAETKTDREIPFAFRLVEKNLPDDEGKEEQPGLSDSHFYIILALAAVIIVVPGMLIRGCTPC